MRGMKASLGDPTDVTQIVEKVHVTSDRKVSKCSASQFAVHTATKQHISRDH